MAFIFALLGIGALLAFADIGSGSSGSGSEDSIDDAQDAENSEEPEEPAQNAPYPDDDTPTDRAELPGTVIEPGLSQVAGFADNATFFLSNEYSGHGSFAAVGEFDSLNLSLYAGDLDVTVDADGNVLVTSDDNDDLAPVFSGVEQVVFGDGTNSFDASDATGSVWALSQGGENTLIGGQGTNYLSSLGGNALIQGGDGTNYLSASMGNDTIVGGAGPNFINAFNDGFVAVTGLDGEFQVLDDVPGITMITDGPGDDEIIAGRGDQITLTGGSNHVEITGYSPADFGPTIISGFDPETDSFEYRVAIREIEPDYGTENPALRDVTLEQRDGDVVLVQSGIDMVRFVGLTLAEAQGMDPGSFIQQGEPNMGSFR